MHSGSDSGLAGGAKGTLEVKGGCFYLERYLLKWPQKYTLARGAGDTTGAIAKATDALALARSIGYARVEADALLTRARARLAANDGKVAEADFADAADILRRHGPRSLLRTLLRDWSAHLVASERHAEAVELLLEASADEAPRTATHFEG